MSTSVKQVLQALCIFLCALQTHAQVITLKGKVIDQKTNKALDAAVITLQDTGQSLLSDEDGSFQVLGHDNMPIIISYMGYETLLSTLSKTNTIFKLTPNNQELDELIIKRSTNINDIDIRNTVGSVVTIDMNQLAERSELDMGKLLQGQIAGLTVNYQGELGSKPEIRIRGNSSFNHTGSANEPLFIMDGMVISTETFLTLNPSDFSTIKVLKDAPATALYGIKAANGVIELTSKRGFDGKPIFRYGMKQGITFRGERTAYMMNTDEKLAFEERIGSLATPGFLYSEKNIRHLYGNSPTLALELAKGAKHLDSLRQYNTDWFKALIKPNHFQSYNMSVRGGTSKNAYFYSLNYSKQGGRIPGNDINHITARANLDYKITDNFNVSLNNSFGISKVNTENGMDNDPTSLAFLLNPYETKDSQSLWSHTGRSYNDLINQYKQKSTTKRFSSSAVLQWDILPELNIGAVLGIDYSLNEENKRIYSTAYSQRNVPENAKGYISQGDNKSTDLTYNLRANYNKQFGDHDLFLGANMDYYHTQIKTLTAAGYGISDDIESMSGINHSLTSSYAPTNAGINNKQAQLGFGATLGYTFQNTYDFYGSFKRDGSSLLPSNQRWNNAWSTGIGWSVHQYPFMQKQSVLTNLKLRGSVGYTASMTGITPRDITTTYSNNQNFYGEHRLLQLLALPNRNLQPQQTYTTNLSIDFGLLNRINLLVSLYNNTTKEAIMSVPMATSNGFNTYTKNIGELENKGVEFMLSGDVLRGNHYGWNTALSLSYNANKVKKLYGTDKIYSSPDDPLPELEVGKPLGVLYGLQDNGIYPLTGLPEYIDNDGNVINFSAPIQEKYFRKIGYSIAPYNGFFNNYLHYKKWSLAINVNYAFGGKASYNRMYVRDEKNAQYNAVQGQLQDMWFEFGDEDKAYPIKELPGNVHDLYRYPTTRTTYKTDYIKLNYIQLSYTLDNNAFINRYFKSLQFGLQADNIYTYRVQKDKGALKDVVQPILTFTLNATF